MNRQQALNQLRIMQAWHEDFGNGPNADYDAICYAIGVIEEMPAGTDTISRQAAIDALSYMCSEDEHGITVSRANVDCMLKALPPAQPETATVTIGRTKGGVTMWYECDACGEPVDQKDNYCRHCGRKLKHE